MGPIEPSFLLILFTAFVGSWHCAGMCGPVALLMGRGRAGVYYQLGRGLGYAILGALAGGFGDQVLYRIHDLEHSTLRFLVFFSAALLLGVTALRLLRPARQHLPKLVRRLPEGLRPWAMGISTAAFPCGWLWSFVAAAAATTHPTAGVLVMLALWLGGIPALTAFAGLKNYLWSHFPVHARSTLVFLLWIASVWGLLSHLWVNSY